MMSFDLLAETGLTVEQIAESAHYAFLRACEGQGFPPLLLNGKTFDDLPFEIQYAWGDVAQLACRMAVTEEEVTAERGGRNCYNNWASRVGAYQNIHYDALSLPNKIAWEAVARHLHWVLNIRNPGEPLDRTQDTWATWAREKNKLLTKRMISDDA